MGNRAIVRLLASGGLDSTALIDFYLRCKNEVECIHFQYGQPSAQSEGKAVEEVCAFYGIEKRIVNLSFSLTKRKEELLGRNALFVLVASSLELPPARIALGIHSGSQHYDCTQSFTDDCQRVLDGYFAGTVTLEAPFINLEKADIIRYCIENKVPIHLTYSCQRQNYPPCGKCTSCRDREMFYGH